MTLREAFDLGWAMNGLTCDMCVHIQDGRDLARIVQGVPDFAAIQSVCGCEDIHPLASGHTELVSLKQRVYGLLDQFELAKEVFQGIPMTNPSTPAATPERVSDELLQGLERECFDGHMRLILRELIARRKAGSAVEAYDDVLGILRRQEELEVDLANLKGLNDRQQFVYSVLIVQKLIKSIEQRRRDAAGDGT